MHDPHESSANGLFRENHNENLRNNVELNKKQSLINKKLIGASPINGRNSQMTKLNEDNTKTIEVSNFRGSRMSTVYKDFEKANWELALKNRQKMSNKFYHGKQVSIFVDLEHFKIYGPGIYLFFNFLKHISALFLITAVISLTPIIYNIFYGTALSQYTNSINLYFAKTSIANFSSSDSNNVMSKYFNTIPDMICSFVFLVFYFYWLHKGDKLTQEVRKQIKMRSYTVVEIQNFPPKTTEADVQKFMSQFGKVTEVAAVKSYDESIYLSKKIYNLQVQIKQLQLGEDHNQQISEKIKQKQEEIDDLFKQLLLYEDDIKQQTIKFFVSYSKYEEKQKALKQLENYQKGFFNNCCFQSKVPQNYLLLGEKIVSKACHTEPGQIIWQNQHVTWKTRWIRALIQFILLLVCISIGFLFISFLNILAPSASTTNIDTSSYTLSTILIESNTTIVQSWCISNAATVIQSSNSSLTNLCWGYIKEYYLKVFLTIAISLSVIIIKAIIRKVVVFLARFQRYKSHTDQSRDIIQNLFLTYVCTTVLITFLLQAQIQGYSFKSTISYFISNDYLNQNLNSLKSYNDYSTNWYIDIGYQIFFTWLIMIIHPNFTMPFIDCLIEQFKFWQARSQLIQSKMEKAMQLNQFQIQDHYANILMVVFVGLSFSGGMPIITLACFFILFFKYFYLKFLFIRYSKIPKTFDQALDLKVTGLLPLALIFHMSFSIWMFGVDSIFLSSTNTSLSQTISSISSELLQNIAFILTRIFGTWYYSAFFVLVLVLFIFKLFFYNLFAKIFFTSQAKVAQLQKINNQNFEDQMKSYSNKSICDSYKIQNNPDYSEVLSIMNKKRKFIVKVKEIKK